MCKYRYTLLNIILILYTYSAQYVIYYIFFIILQLKVLHSGTFIILPKGSIQLLEHVRVIEAEWCIWLQHYSTLKGGRGVGEGGGEGRKRGRKEMWRKKE